MKSGRIFRILTSAGAFCVVLIGFAASPVVAEDDSDQVLLRAQQSREQRRAVVQEFVSELGLSRYQVRRILSLVDRAAGLYADRYEFEGRALPEILEAFGDFAREDSLNRGFTPRVERRTARVNRQLKLEREEYVERMLELEAQALDILSESQRGFAEQFNPGNRKGRRADRQRGAGSRRGRGQGRLVSNPTGRLRQAREELTQLNHQIHHRLGPIGEYLLHPAAGEVLCDALGTRPNQRMRDGLDAFDRGTGDFPAALFASQRAEVGKLRAEINNWNLINGLHLNGEQIRRIVEVCDAAQVQMRRKDRAGDGPARFGRAKNRAKRDRVKPREVRAALEQAVGQIMNPGQRQVLADYKACLIPPKNLKNPVRVGQANDSSGFERLLTRARRMPERRLETAIDGQIEKEAERFGELSAPERRDRFRLIRDVVKEAAGLSDTEFELDKAELAQRIAPRDRAKELKQEIGELSRAKGLPGRVAQFMLKPQFVEQLRVRGQQLADGTVPEPTNLTSGPQAPNCEKGCAVKPKGKKQNRKRS